MSKYHSIKVKRDGYTFDSKAEARRWDELKLLERNGDISHLVVYPKYPILVNNYEICTYIADFQYVELATQAIITEDVKSPVTRKLPVYRIKKKLMFAVHGINIVEIEA